MISANVKRKRDLLSAMSSHSDSNLLQRAAAAALNAVGKHVDLDARVTVSPAWATHTAAAFGASSSALLDDRLLAGSSVGAVGTVERVLVAILDLVVLALTTSSSESLNHTSAWHEAPSHSAPTALAMPQQLASSRSAVQAMWRGRCHVRGRS